MCSEIKILLLEDDRNLSFIIKDDLESLGYNVIHVVNGNNLKEIIDSEKINLLLMDVELEEGHDGFELALQLRNNNYFLPIIFTTARTSGKDIEKGLKMANTDYVKKPFSVKEIALRINALLGTTDSSINYKRLGAYIIDLSSNQVYGFGEKNRISHLESECLSFLISNINEVVDKETLITRIWGDGIDVKSKENSLNNIIHKLRMIFEEDKSLKIETYPKKGFRITNSKFTNLTK
jgi:DNA-binding response OmpR family regulator